MLSSRLKGVGPPGELEDEPKENAQTEISNGEAADSEMRHATQREGDKFQFYDLLDESKKEVRFIRLLQKQGPLQCQIATFSLLQEPEYKALSYCWTEADATECILVNETAFYVRPNLEEFLRLLVSEGDYESWIFVDAICINQDDIDERSNQVRLMRQVYEGAQLVYAWLGSAGGLLEDEMLEYLASPKAKVKDLISEADRNAGQEDWTWSRFMNIEASLLADSERVEIPVEAVVILRPFLDYEYWSRVWIVQEIVLAKSVVFRWGAYTIGAEVLYRLLFPHAPPDLMEDPTCIITPAIGKYTDLKGNFFPLAAAWRILALRRRFQALGPVAALLSLPEAITTFGCNKCSNSYDKIFGILGLTNSSLRADYRKSKIELFVEVLVAGLMPLLLANTSTGEDSDFVLKPGSSYCTMHMMLFGAFGCRYDDPVMVLVSHHIYQIFDIGFDALLHNLAWLTIFRNWDSNKDAVFSRINSLTGDLLPLDVYEGIVRRITLKQLDLRLEAFQQGPWPATRTVDEELLCTFSSYAACMTEVERLVVQSICELEAKQESENALSRQFLIWLVSRLRYSQPRFVENEEQSEEAGSTK